MNANTRTGSPWLIVTIALLTMVGPFTIDTYLPSFPDIEATFDVNRTLMLQSISFYLVASAVSTLFWGPLSDRIGRRQVILGSSTLFVVASMGCAWSESYSSFLFFRVVQGMAASGGMVAGRAMIRDAHDSHSAHRAMAYVMMLFAMAPAIAPIIGGWLHDTWGWRSVFLFLTLYGAVMIPMTLKLLPETLDPADRRSFHPAHVMRLYISTVLHPRFRALVLALGVSFAGLFTYIAGSPTVIYDFLGLDSSHFAVQFVPMTLGIVAGSFISGRLAQRWQTPHIVWLGFFLMGTACILNLAQSTWLTPTVFTVIAPLVVYALGMALAIPGVTILALDCFPENRGTASAVQGFVQVIMAALVSSLIIPLLGSTILGMATGQALCLLCGLLLWALVGSRKPA
jgi:DHA1 family bicyclomycin/chloramphenicol resistance-like MFS transporter